LLLPFTRVVALLNVSENRAPPHSDYGREAIGHFNLFHDSHAAGFWTDALQWLKGGSNPWPRHVIER
ncbi:hypothetical protein, partial [Gluconacetobacter sacchari]